MDQGFLAGLAGGLQGGLEGYKEGLERQRQKRKDALDELYHQAPLLEQGYKIEESADQEHPFKLTESGGPGSVKKQLDESNLRKNLREEKNAPQQARAERLRIIHSQQEIERAQAEAEAAKHATDPQNILRKQEGRMAPRTAGLMNLAQENKKLIDALQKGVPLHSLNPFAGTTEAGLALEGVKSAMRQAGQKEDGTPGNFDDSELPSMLDTPEIRAKKLMKIQEDTRLALGNMGVADHPSLKDAWVQNIDLSKAAPTIGQAVRHPIDTAKGLIGNAFSNKDIQKSTATPNVGHPQDNEAVKWAKSNPNNPKSQEILRLNGVK